MTFAIVAGVIAALIAYLMLAWMQNSGPSFRAGGTIAPSHFVTMDVTADNQVVQVTATTQPIMGVSQEGMLGTPGLSGSDVTVAAQANNNIGVTCAGNVALINASAAITRGDLLGSTSSGTAVTLASISANQQVGGIALESASGAGVLIKIWVLTYLTYW